MKKLFYLVLCFSFVVLIAGGCTASQKEKKIIKKSDAPVVHKNTLIKPRRMYEECLEVLPTQIIDYSFKTSKPVSFNIHYHGEDRIYYPVKKDNTAEWSGALDISTKSYYSENQEYFCLMWENPYDESVRLNFKCHLRSK
jgi:hypothetical protein